MTNVVITVGVLNPGGVEVRTLEFLQYLARARIFDTSRITIYVISGMRGALDGLYLESGVSIVYGRPGLFGLIHFGRFLYRTSPKVIHVNASYASGLYCFVGSMLRVPVRISHLRSAFLPEMSRLRAIKYSLYLPLLWLFSSRVLGVTEQARITGRIPLSKWALVYDGFLDPRAALGFEKELRCIREDRKIIAIIGRMHECKNLGFAAKVVAELGRRVHVEVWFIGQEDIQIKADIEETLSGVSGVSCQYFGSCSHEKAMFLLGKADVLLLTSTREGLPGVCIEALSRGVPVVASDLPGVLEISTYFPCIFPLSLESPVTAWADRVSSVLEDPSPDTESMRSAFNNSPFSMQSHVEHVLREWQDGA